MKCGLGTICCLQAYFLKQVIIGHDFLTMKYLKLKLHYFKNENYIIILKVKSSIHFWSRAIKFFSSQKNFVGAFFFTKSIKKYVD